MPSPTIKGFLQQAEDDCLALLRKPRQLQDSQARDRVSRLLRESPESNDKDAREQLELQARTMLGLDRRLRGVDARFKALEKAIASAAELAAASSRCGRDGIEAATAAAAAVRVEAEAKCRDLSKRIDGLTKPLREDAQRVREWLGEDLQCIERRLLTRLEEKSHELFEASRSAALELQAEVRVELAALRNDLSRPRGGKDVEHRLHSAEEDLRRAVHGVSELETRVQGEERVYWTVVQSLEQRVGSLEASAASPLEDRMRRLEAEIAKLPHAAKPSEDLTLRRPRGILASAALAEAAETPPRERVELRPEEHVVSPASSSSAPSPHLRGVPLQPSRRPSRSSPGPLRPKGEHDRSEGDVQAPLAVPIPEGRVASGSSSPTLSDSPNFSELLRSSVVRSDGPSSGSRSPMIVTQPPPRTHTEVIQLPPGDADEDEPVCAFSTNVSEGFRSDDELDLP